MSTQAAGDPAGEVAVESAATGGAADPSGIRAPSDVRAPGGHGLGRRAQVLETLAVAAEAHERAARSPRTRAAYARDWAHFARWCELAGLTARPAAPDTLRLYLSDLEAARTEAGAVAYQPATLARRLAAISAAHREAGHPSPTRDPRVAAVLTGIRRARRHTPHRMRPLLLDDVRTLLAGMDYASWPAGLTSARDGFVLLAGFTGALRRSELAALRIDDLHWHAEDGLHLRIRSSKTDQEAAGAVVVLPFGVHPGTCPPCAALRWLRLLAAGTGAGTGRGRPALMRAVLSTPPWSEWTHLYPHPHPGDPGTAPGTGADRAGGDAPVDPAELTRRLAPETMLLRGIRKGGHLSPTAVTGDGLHVMVKRRAAAAGLPGPVGFHSLRAGFVTQARRAGADTRAVRRQTRHTSDAMVELYDRDHAPLLGNAVTVLGL